MGIGITPQQQELAAAVSGWARRTVPPEEVRKLLDAPAAGRPAYWDSLAGQGFLAPHVPEEHGGGGGELLDAAVVLEEAARAALPGPFLAHTLALSLLRSAGATELLPAAAEGRVIAAVALDAGSLVLTGESGSRRLTGTAPPVLGGGDADLILVAALPEAVPAAQGAEVPGAAPDSGRAGAAPVWLALDAATLSVRPHESADPTRPTAEVTAESVPVPEGRLLAGLDPEAVRDLAALHFAADACGTAAWALHTATEYAKVREQFGRPIGKFQAVKHLCADMLVRLEQARALTWDAARAAEDAPADERALTASLAAAVALDASFSCAKDCIQILGGIGFTWEHDAHLHLRRALVARRLLGVGDDHRLRAMTYAETGARRELRLELPPEADEFRASARDAATRAVGLDPGSARRELAPTGYAAPHLPAPYGLGAGPLQQLAVQQELNATGVRLSGLGIATWVVPSLIAHGTEGQRERYLLPTLKGELQWCQLFSEPGAGSDLASLRTRAEQLPDGRWRITGQKVWTSVAQWADHGILLARTDADAPKHEGLTYFLVDMKNPAEGSAPVDIRPLKEISGDTLFNEVFFDEVILPADAVVGKVGEGWKVARHTLGNERVHMADQVSFDTGLQSLIAAAAGRSDAFRVRVAALAAEAHALACISLRTTLQQVSGLEPGPGASVRKLVQTTHQQALAETALELFGSAGAVREGAAERALHGFLMSRCLTIAGGTTQVQLNVVAERLLGLPRD